MSENEIKKNKEKGTITLVASKKYEIHIGNDYVKELNKVSGTTNINDNKKLALKKTSDSNSSSLVKYIILCIVILFFALLYIGVVYKKKSKGKKQKNPTEDLENIEEAHDGEDTAVVSLVEESQLNIPDNTQDGNNPVEINRSSDVLVENEELKQKNEALCKIVTKICELLKLNKNVDYVLVNGASVIYDEIKDLQNGISDQENGDESHREIYKNLLEVFRSEEHIRKLMPETLDEQKCQSYLDTFKTFAKIVN